MGFELSETSELHLYLIDKDGKLEKIEENGQQPYTRTISEMEKDIMSYDCNPNYSWFAKFRFWIQDIFI